MTRIFYDCELIGTDELWNEVKRWLKQRGIGVAGPLPGDDPELPTYMTYPIQEPRHAPLTDESCGVIPTKAVPLHTTTESAPQ